MRDILPSLEHNRLLYPRPRPTILSTPPILSPARNKGKERAIEEDEDTYEPEQAVGGDDDLEECNETSRVRKGWSRGSKKGRNQKKDRPISPVIDKENLGKFS